MTTTRQDAWTQDEDLLLAEVVLKIRFVRVVHSFKRLKKWERNCQELLLLVDFDGIQPYENNIKQGLNLPKNKEKK